jgi:hypothetical protein
MTHAPRVQRGKIVTYLEPDVFATVPFALGVLAGTSVIDPETGRLWVSVLRPDRTTLVLDAANIVQASPSPDIDMD